MTSCKHVQSSRNWMWSGWAGLVYEDTIGSITGFIWANFIEKINKFSLVWSREGQKARMCSKSSWISDPWQVGVRHHPFLFADQCLHNNSVLYLPDSIRAWTMALDTSYDDEFAAVHSWCGVERDMNSGWKYFSDGSCEASCLYLHSQYLRTADLVSFLKASFDSGFFIRSKGWGSWYNRQISLTWQEK